ncbi:MAG: HAD-IIB family hydrolase [Saprospiraceae bacterium]|nr:HAD-IIB family hydrolase [Saprospiraceae bacterium]
MMPSLPIAPEQPLLLFTDLDGTLIDHHSYSAEKSRLAILRLAQRGIPLIFCSSKTFAEQIHLQRELGIIQPFIVENGSAVAIPKGYFSTPALSADTAYDLIPLVQVDAAYIRREMAHYQGIQGFTGATDLELNKATGLTGDALKYARDRSYTETLLTPLTPETEAFIRPLLALKGLTISRGGRFFSVQSANTDKGRAVRWLADHFSQHLSAQPLLAACGDSANDASMLSAVDLPFLVQQPGKKWADMDIPGLVKVPEVGPAGFSRVVQMLL